MSLGERIKRRRQSLGLSQEKLAELMEVSRQAVTKWESGSSAPSTQNLLRLSQVLGTTVESLTEASGCLDADRPEPCSPKGDVPSGSVAFFGKGRVFWVFAILFGYLAVYLVGRCLWGDFLESSFLGWLFGTDSSAYLYGWLLKSGMFWAAAAVSAAGAALGKIRFSLVTLASFVLGLVLGEWLGPNPAGAFYGLTHYGWAIWGGIFLFSMAMGAVLERMAKKGDSLLSKSGLIWLGITGLGILLIILLVRGAMAGA